MGVKYRRRWVIAILWVGFSLSAAVTAFFGGLIISTSATNVCTSLPDWSTFYLFLCWPIILLAGALLPAVLIVRGEERDWVLRAILGGGIVSLAWFLAWLPLVRVVCEKA